MNNEFKYINSNKKRQKPVTAFLKQAISANKNSRRKIYFAAAACAVVLIIVIVVAVSVIKNSGGGLKGVWRFDDVTVYEFNGNGTGVMHTAINDYAFSYVAKGKNLTIDFESDAARDCEYSYTVKGNTLTLKSSDESSYVLKKQ